MLLVEKSFVETVSTHVVSGLMVGGRVNLFTYGHQNDTERMMLRVSGPVLYDSSLPSQRQ